MVQSTEQHSSRTATSTVGAARGARQGRGGQDLCKVPGVWGLLAGLEEAGSFQVLHVILEVLPAGGHLLLLILGIGHGVDEQQQIQCHRHQPHHTSHLQRNTHHC